MRKKIILTDPPSPQPDLISRSKAIIELSKLMPPEESFLAIMQKRVVQECIRRLDMLPGCDEKPSEN